MLRFSYGIFTEFVSGVVSLPNLICRKVLFRSIMLANLPSGKVIIFIMDCKNKNVRIFALCFMVTYGVIFAPYRYIFNYGSNVYLR